MSGEQQSLTICARGGKHEWRRLYSGKRFDVLRCRRCRMLVTEKDGVRA